MAAQDDPRKPMTLQTVERAFGFLEHVATAPEPPTVREVATALGLNITTAHHLFNTLHALGYVDRDSERAIRIAARVSLLHQAYQRTASSDAALSALVAALAEATGETASASMVVGNRVVIQALVESRQPVRATGLYVGLSGSEHLRASGRVVLAMLDDDRRAAMLDTATNGLPEPEREQIQRRVLRESADVRAQGWAVDHGGYQAEIAGVSAPVFDALGSIIGTVNLSTPEWRFTSRRDELIAATTKAARAATELRSTQS